jgi:erythromycin esterase-like protein
MGALVRPGRVVLLGEVHGTHEFPALVAAVAERAVAGGVPVTIGLEIPSTEQPAVDAYLDGRGGVAELTAGTFWRRPPADHDGRASVAIVALLTGVRGGRAAGADLDVVAFDLGRSRSARQDDRDAAMAAHLVDAARARSGGCVLVLAGNDHTRLTAEPELFGPDRLPMGWHLAQHLTDVVSLTGSTRGGTAWCITDPEAGGAVQELAPSDQPADHPAFIDVGPVTAAPPVSAGR